MNFNFGANWHNYSKKALNKQQFEEAKGSLLSLIGVKSFDGMRFLDIGCGSGIFAAAACALNAKEVVGIDLNPLCVKTAALNTQSLIGSKRGISFEEMSILDESRVNALGLFDCVYAWGSLHHTGSMWEAIHNAARLVRPHGTLALAIYNKHWTSRGWSFIKKAYNASPPVLQKCMNILSVVPIFIAKASVTRKNPLTKERGMSFYYDVVDWIGGYPYEYASVDQVVSFVQSFGFDVMRVIPAATPIGNNEFVFKKREGLNVS